MKNGIVCMCKYVINVCNTKCILEKNTCDYNIKLVPKSVFFTWNITNKLSFICVMY